MFIEVTDNYNEIVFRGEADIFLEINDYDSEIEEKLNELDRYSFGSKVALYGNFGDSFIAEKIDDEEMEE